MGRPGLAGRSVARVGVNGLQIPLSFVLEKTVVLCRVFAPVVALCRCLSSSSSSREGDRKKVRPNNKKRGGGVEEWTDCGLREEEVFLVAVPPARGADPPLKRRDMSDIPISFGGAGWTGRGPPGRVTQAGCVWGGVDGLVWEGEGEAEADGARGEPRARPRTTPNGRRDYTRIRPMSVGLAGLRSGRWASR